MPTALVRRPGPKLADGLVTHQARVPVDLDRAVDQWEHYVEVLREHGWTIVEVEPADDCPDAVFVEDALVMFDELAVVTRPGAPTRRFETAGVELAARRLGLEVVELGGDDEATLDGGDVMKIGRSVYIGVGGRTTPAAVAHLAVLLAPRDWLLRPVPVRSVLHLKSAVTALPDGTVIGHPDHVDDPTPYDRFLDVPEPAGAHVVQLGGDRILMSAAAPRTAELLRSRGLDPVAIDIGEFEKLEGCVTCLSVRVRGQAEVRPVR